MVNVYQKLPICLYRFQFCHFKMANPLMLPLIGHLSVSGREPYSPTSSLMTNERFSTLLDIFDQVACGSRLLLLLLVFLTTLPHSHRHFESVCVHNLTNCQTPKCMPPLPPPLSVTAKPDLNGSKKGACTLVNSVMP